MKNNKKKDFLTTLSSMTPEEVTEMIFNNSKIKVVKNVVIRLDSNKIKQE